MRQNKRLKLTGHCFKLEDEGNHEDCLDGKKTWDQDHGSSGKIQVKVFLSKSEQENSKMLSPDFAIIHED